jgi:CheY-like chemotaxis protein
VQDTWHAADALYIMEIAAEAGTPVDVVIADEAMSGIDAPLFATLVREDDRFLAARLVLLERSTEGDAGRYAAAGFDGRIGYTADSESPADVISELLASSPPPPVAAEPSVGVAHDDESKGPSILIVEDNVINMEVICEMTERIGYRCDRAVNGHEAVDLALRNHYGLVLMDCQLPGMDGYEATRRIRTWEESLTASRRVPIVAVTAHAMTGDRDRCLAAGMDDYMTKPVDAGKLASMIARWLTPSTTSDHEAHSDATREQ